MTASRDKRGSTSILLVIIFFLVHFVASGQDQPRISIHANNTSFKDFVRDVEAQTKLKFYYRAQWTDSIRVTLEANNETLASVLEKAFAGTDLQFSVHANTVYVTNARPLTTELPVDFFNQGDVGGREAIAFDYSEYERKGRQKNSEERLFVIGTRTADLSGSATITGNLTDVKSGEAVVGAAIFIENPRIGVSTDPFGHYSLTLPRGRHVLKLQSVGMKSTQRQIMLYSNGRLNIEMEEEVIPLKEVLVESERDVRVTGMQMGMEKLDIKTIKQLPLVLGETDIMKAILVLPGVQSVGEGTVGLNIRGGAANQNLILFNDAVVFNPSHMFGFFSTFNPDVIKNAELYKSGITANYGGRLSAVLDVNSREGNLKKFSLSGGISPATSRLTLEGPILKDRTSFVLGVRSTYSDWILKQLDYKNLKNSSASFYDITAAVTHKINDGNTISFSGYMSKDQFKLGTDTTYRYGDSNASLKWKHVFNPKLFGALSASVSQYDYSVSSDENPVNASIMNYSIKQLNARADINYFMNTRNSINGGLSVTRYGIQPGTLDPVGSESIVTPDILQQEQGIESAVYIDDSYEINSKLTVYAGLRYSLYSFIGPKDVYQYANGQSREEATITDTLKYGSGETIATYGGLEPRFSIRYLLPRSASIKFSYNRMRQYIQMLSNTAVISPIDIWKLSDAHIKPQFGDQYSVGFYKNLRRNTIEASIEGYYKTMQNSVDYKNGAELLLNHHLETDVINAEGHAYGVELLLKKSSGKVNGWLSYTYSRSLLKSRGEYSSEEVNDGNYYPSSYDKPHAFNFIGNYKFNRRFNVSLNLVYSTGRPITYPIATYQIEGVNRILYGDRNQERIPDYFRTDISVNVEGNHRVRKLAHSSWTFAVYNLTGRNNVYSIFFVSQNGVVNGYKLSIFAQPIPTITYNFRF